MASQNLTDPTALMWRAEPAGQRAAAAVAADRLPQQPAPNSLGWAPWLALLMALGVALVVYAYTAARFSESSHIALMYWVGLLCMYSPIALRLCLPGPTRTERVALILILTLGLYLFKITLSPNFLYLSDEFTHWLSTNNILKAEGLFRINPILPTSAYYPGLHIATSALVQLSGLSIFHASILVIGATRLVLTLGLFVAFERASGSARIAGLAMLVYAANPNFIFYGQQFGYESLSLPLACLIIALLAWRDSLTMEDSAFDLNAMIVVLIFAVVPTHHMTSYALIGLLGLWTVVRWLEKRQRLALLDRIILQVERLLAWLGGRFGPLRRLLSLFNLWPLNVGEWRDEQRPSLASTHLFLILAAALTVLWLLEVATITIGYLSPVLGGAIGELLALISGEIGAKETFKAVDGFAAPLWERLISFGAVGLILLGLPFGWLTTWRRYRRTLSAVVLTVASLAYPMTLAMRMTEKGSETANRSSEFLFTAIGFVLAVAFVEMWFKRGAPLWRVLVVTGYMTLLFMGGNITGQAWWARLPGEYVVGGDTLSIQPESINAALWAAQHLGPSNRVIADGLNLKMMASYGEQRIVRKLSWVFFSRKLDGPVQVALDQNNVQYVVVDQRITRYLPINGHYFESQEPNAKRHREPFDASRLVKFLRDAHVSRLFDSGNLLIYDVSHYGELTPPLP